MSEKGSSGIVQVTIALIGLVGSLGVAYITTGAKFQKELDKATGQISQFGTEVTQLKGSAQEIKNTLASQQGEVDQRLADLKKQLADAESRNNEFQNQLASLRSEIDSSKQKVNEVNTAATSAITRIQAAEARIIRNRSVATPSP